VTWQFAGAIFAAARRTVNDALREFAEKQRQLLPKE